MSAQQRMREIPVERRGRKRKSRHRHPCGQLIDPSRAEVTEAEKALAKVIAINQPHRRGVPEALRHDQKAENVLGRLELGGKITRDEYEAGRWYARVVHQYRQSIFCPNPNPNSIAGATVTGAGGQPYTEDIEAIRRKGVYDLAFEALDRRGQRYARAVARAAVHNEAPDAEALPYLQEGLHALSIHKGLTKHRDRAIKIQSGANVRQ